jgi:membrane dipeptidase
VSLTIDLHADTPLLMHWTGYHFCSAHRPWLPMGAWWSHVDLPRMRKAQLDLQLFGLVTLPMEGDPYSTVHSMIDRVEQSVAVSDGLMELVEPNSELPTNSALSKVMLSIEGVHPLGGKLERADALFERGVASFGLAHFHANEACRPAYGLGCDANEGLTPFGRELVEHLGNLGAIVDLTHINRRGFFDALDCGTGRIMVSHTGVRGVYDHWRNLDDEQLRAVAEKGGVVGIIFARQFLGGNDMSAVVQHIEHVLSVAGEESPALGSDFDGFIVPVRGLRDVTGLPALRESLLRRGHSQALVDRIMGGNAARVLSVRP